MWCRAALYIDNQRKERSKTSVKMETLDDAAFLMKNASSVIIVPGYGGGRLVAQAQLCAERDGRCT